MSALLRSFKRGSTWLGKNVLPVLAAYATGGAGAAGYGTSAGAAAAAATAAAEIQASRNSAGGGGPPVTLPDEEQIAAARKRATALQVQRSGRASTFLDSSLSASSSSSGDTLGPS